MHGILYAPDAARWRGRRILFTVDMTRNLMIIRILAGRGLLKYSFVCLSVCLSGLFLYYPLLSVPPSLTLR